MSATCATDNLMGICDAVSQQTGQRCRQHVKPGRSKCHYHGGNTPRGIASPQHKHGRYSSVLPARLAGAYQAAISDPDLLHLKSDIALLDSRLADVISQVSNSEAGELWKNLKQAVKDYRKAKEDDQYTALQQILWFIEEGYTEYQSWIEIRSMLQERKSLVESERKRLVDMQQMITSNQAMLLIGAIYETIRANVTDKGQLAAISNDIEKLIAIEPK